MNKLTKLFFKDNLALTSISILLIIQTIITGIWPLLIVVIAVCIHIWINR